MKNSALQAIDDQHRLAEIGLGDEQRDDDGEQDEGEDVAGNVGAPRVLGEQPGDDDDEGRLHELGRLERQAERD